MWSECADPLLQLSSSLVGLVSLKKKESTLFHLSYNSDIVATIGQELAQEYIICNYNCKFLTFNPC